MMETADSTAIASPDRYDMLSPTIVYDDFRDVFILWANNTGDVGYQNGQANFVEMRYSDDGITWGEPVRVNGFLGLDENGQQLAPWASGCPVCSRFEGVCLYFPVLCRPKSGWLCPAPDHIKGWSQLGAGGHQAPAVPRARRQLG